jgi:UDP-hydrolysing UDP-N-acetyl-D-glucosamine 2-epimerase
MRKICVVIANRAEYSRLKSILKSIHENKNFKLILIGTSSLLLEEYGKTIDSIKNDGFHVDAIARTLISGGDPVAMTKSVGLCCLELPTLYEMYKPDIVIVGFDRFDSFGAAITAALMNIPLAHIQGGELTGTIDESIRHAMTKLAHIHFPATQKSAERIIRMGENPDRVFNVGCPSVDIIKDVTIGSRTDLCNKYHLDPKQPFIIWIQHPVTTEFSSTQSHIIESLNAITELNIQTIGIYPNPDAGTNEIIKVIEKIKASNDNKKIQFHRHIDFEDFIRLLAHCDCIVGNSSSGMRESCYFGTPTVNIGTRQNRRECGSNVLNVGNDRKAIMDGITKSLKHGRYEREFIYGTGDTGEKIVRILEDIRLDGIVHKYFFE